MLRHHWTISLLGFTAFLVGARTGHALLDPQTAFYLNLALVLAVAILGVILVFVAASYLTVLFCGWGLRHQLESSYTLLWGWNMLRSQRDIVPPSYRFNRWLDDVLPSKRLFPKSLILILAGGDLGWDLKFACKHSSRQRSFLGAIF